MSKLQANEPCVNCGGNRWRTVESGQAWQCHRCGFVRGNTTKPYPVVPARSYAKPTAEQGVVLAQSQSPVKRKNWLQKLLRR